MARMNTRGSKPRNMATTPVNTTTGRAFTAEGGTGWQRTPKGELFLAAVTSLNEDTFYETADERVNRIQTLATDPEIVNSPEWALGMVRWLRQEVGLRSIPGVVAMTVVKARLDAGLTGPDTQDTIRKAALTHEVIAGAIGTIPADVWETLVPNMGYMALRMNLRRIEASGASRSLVATINERLSDVEEAAKSRTMPVSFYAAYKNAPLTFAAALQDAANASLENVPELKGRTLVLLDRSYSMSAPLSAKSSLSCQDTANVFASALALRSENVRVVAFDNHMEDVNVNSSDLLRVVDQMPTPRGGTYTPEAIRWAHEGGRQYDRIVILTDEQYTGDSVDKALDTYAPGVPVFTWNLAGYRTAQMEAREGRWTFGGLSDKGFQMIPLLERGIGQSWPWE